MEQRADWRKLKKKKKELVNWDMELKKWSRMQSQRKRDEDYDGEVKPQ